MKKLLVLAVLISSSVMAGERVVVKESKTFNVPINSKTVRCDDRGYGILELRLYIKELNGWTKYNHADESRININLERLPRLIAGTCTGDLGPGYEIDDVIKGNPRTEKIVVTRELVESRYVADSDSTMCLRTFNETITTKIFGIEFKHVYSDYQDRLHISECTF